MKNFWFLNDNGEIKYAGKFKNFNECDQAIEKMEQNAVWIFDKKPEVEPATEMEMREQDWYGRFD